MENVQLEIDQAQLEHNFAIKITKKVTNVKVVAANNQTNPIQPNLRLSRNPATIPVRNGPILRSQSASAKAVASATTVATITKDSGRRNQMATIPVRNGPILRSQSASAKAVATISKDSGSQNSQAAAASVATIATKVNKRRQKNPPIDEVVKNSKRAKGNNAELVRYRSFEINEFVVTKVRGWSAWPAQVQAINQIGRKYKVKYFGFENLTGDVGSNEIFHLDEQSMGMLEDVMKKKPNTKGFIKSLREVEIEFNFTFPFPISE